MQTTDIPTRFTKVWAANAGAGFIRTVPVNSQIGIQDGAASFTDGFVPDNFLPIAGGGVPPFGQDFNGILEVMTAWEQWTQAGGPITYNTAFSTAIGGYPKGAMLSSATSVGLFWVSTVDGNTTDPDGGGAANWQGFSTLQIATTLETQTGANNAKAISPLALKNAGFKYVVAENLIEIDGYRAYSDGFVECWGMVTVPGNSFLVVGLPYAHTLWVNPSGSGMLPNTGSVNVMEVSGIIVSGGVPTGFQVCNAHANASPFWWNTRGK